MMTTTTITVMIIIVIAITVNYRVRACAQLPGGGVHPSSPNHYMGCKAGSN